MAQKLLSGARGSEAQRALLKAKEKQATYYSRNARERRPLKVGDVVSTRLDKRRPWTKAEVVKV